MLANGTSLGPYEITGHIGAGGMGEVYRARDTRLDRMVAVKVLPSRLSADPRLRERFEREAKAISSLSHPNICTLFDVGSHNGVEYLVMELLEGESLAERLARGPLPIEQVVRYGVEIADALQKAHRAGIVHRDLKPGNVVLTKSGAKLLDFGLAKFAQPAVATHPDAATAAMSHQKPLTEEGSILGTFQYMAPEQIEGRDADSRTDIFALGALLYEMATGKRAFEAKSKASLIASILDRDPPPISAIQPLTPPAFERVVRMCLAKDADERWQSAHDVAAELRWIASSSGETIGPVADRHKRRRTLETAAAVTAALLVGAAASWLVARSRGAEPKQVARFTVQTPPSAPMFLEYAPLAISPDGTRIVYRALVGENSTLYIHATDTGRAVAVAGTEGAHSPVFSPDGRWIAFFDSRAHAIFKVPRDGGARAKVADSPGGGLGLDWQGNTIYATREFAGGLWAVSADGGTPRQFAKTNPTDQRAIVWPAAIPGTDVVLATAWNAGSWDTARITAYSTKDGTSKVVVEGGSFARYSPTGHLLFMRGGDLMAVPFDAKTLEAGRNAVAVVKGVAHGTADGEALYAISRAGHLVFASGGDVEPLYSLMWLDPSGRRTPIVPTRRRYGSVDVAPDARSAVVTVELSTYDVWHLDFERDSVTRISHGGDDYGGVITHDGNRVIWTSSRAGPYNLYWRPLDNSGPDERVVPANRSQFHPAFSADGKFLVYAQSNGTQADLWLLPLDTRKPRPLVASEFGEGSPSISPDGRWLAYVSTASGQEHVYVTAFPQPAGKWQVSTDGGGMPRWTPDSRGIVYVHGRDILLAPFESTPRPRAGKPRVIATGQFDEDYSVASDGRIAVIEGEKIPTLGHFQVVLNWAEELKRRVPVP